MEAGWSNPSSQPVPNHPRTDADVQQGQSELKLGEVIATIPKIDLNEKSVEYKNRSFTLQKEYRGNSQKSQRRSEDKLLLESRTSQELSGKCRLKDLAKKNLGTHTVQTAQKQRSELVDATKLSEA